jgi:hypothetical protein
MKPVGGQGPLLGGGSNHSGPNPKAHHIGHHPKTRTSGAANGGGDN